MGAFVRTHCSVWLFMTVVLSFASGGWPDMIRAEDRPLASYLWKNRVVVVVADSEHRSVASRQWRMLSGARVELLERDMVVVGIMDDVVEIDGVIADDVDATALRRGVSASEAEFSVLLIGKDGGVKLRSDALVDAERLFALIDAMPMRRQEMRRQSERTS